MHDSIFKTVLSTMSQSGCTAFKTRGKLNHHNMDWIWSTIWSIFFRAKLLFNCCFFIIFFKLINFHDKYWSLVFICLVAPLVFLQLPTVSSFNPSVFSLPNDCAFTQIVKAFFVWMCETAKMSHLSELALTLKVCDTCIHHDYWDHIIISNQAVKGLLYNQYNYSKSGRSGFPTH